MDTARRIHDKINIYQDKRDKDRVFAEQYKKASAEAKSKKPSKYAILRRGSNSGYKLDLEAFQR